MKEAVSLTSCFSVIYHPQIVYGSAVWCSAVTFPVWLFRSIVHGDKGLAVDIGPS